MAHHYMAGALRDNGSWHNREILTGGIFTGQTTIKEQMERSSLDYEVIVSPSYYEWQGKYVEIPGRYNVIVPKTKWNDGPLCIRQIGNRYSVLQNLRIAELFEPLQETYPLESLGVLKDGKIVYVELKMESYEVGGNERELHNSYLAFSNDHTQGSAFLGLTTTRIVCWNTYSQSLKDLESIPHSTDLDLELAFRTTVMSNSIQARKEHKLLLDRMFVHPIKKDEFATLVEAVFPYPKQPRAMRIYESVDPLGLDTNDEIVATFADNAMNAMSKYERSVERQKELRMDVGQVFAKFNDEQPYCANTVYAAFQATSEILNHSPRFSGAVDKNMVSLFFGQKKNMLDSAWATCVELIK